MRIAIDRHDPGYQPAKFTTKAIIHLDGVLQTKCTIADEEKGFIERYTTSTATAIRAQFGLGGPLPRERVKGVVTVTWPEGFDTSQLIQRKQK